MVNTNRNICCEHIFIHTHIEGKAMATAYDCKFIETSVGINHNVDELLVGLLTQIRLKLENPEKSRFVNICYMFFFPRNVIYGESHRQAL